MMVRSLIMLLMVFCASCAFGQEWDFFTWHRLKAGGDLTKKISLSIEQQVRLNENSSGLDQTFTELGLGYDFPKGFDLSGAYRFSWAPNEDRSFKNRHRYNIDLNYGKKFWRLKPKVRVRFQHRPSTYLINDRLAPEQSPMTIRLKVSIDYTKLKKWTPGIAFEAFFSLNNPVDNGAYKFRYRAYLNYDLPKRQKFGLFYMLETDYSDSAPFFSSVVGVNYAYEWKRPKKNKDKE
jgi:hypothetical protein